MRARPCANVERHAFGDRTAIGASLRAWEPSPAFDKRLARARGLVFQNVRKHSPSRIACRSGEAVVLHHSLHVQIFDSNHLVFVYDPSRQLVQVVFAGAGDARVRACDQLAAFCAPTRSFLFAGRHPLFAFQVPLSLAKMARIVEFRAVAGDGEVRQPNIHTDCLAVSRDGELRQRMPDLRMREQTDQAELQAIADQSAERSACLRLAETVTDFLGRLRSSAGTLDVSERQRVLRLLVKDIHVGDDKIVIRHSIPLPTNRSQEPTQIFP
ncbi:hypothetical protein MHY1_p00235 (plasmid) [Methylovirgula sp. HY1]|nr:hypothetical protein MHY1_p00235 [Methylovirgula sp. HY1]